MNPISTGHDLCPRCGNPLPKDNLAAGINACSCGWSDNTKSGQQMTRNTTRSLRGFMLKIIVILTPVLIYMAQWRGFGLEVLALKVSSMLGLASTNSQKHLADIYLRTGRSKEALDIYKSILQHNPKEWSIYILLAQYQRDQKQFAEAAQTYSDYLKNGGEDKDRSISFQQARALEQSGNLDAAGALYKQILDAEPDVLQVGIAQAYAKMLIASGKLDEAKKLIHDFQSHGQNGKDYLNEELSEIEQKTLGH